MKIKTLCSLLTATSLFLVAFVNPSVVLPLINHSVYADGLGPGWQDYSWASVNLSATAPVHSGSNSIAVTFTGGWQGLALHKGGVDVAGVTHLRFFMHGGGSGGQKMNIYLNLVVNGADQNGPAISVTPPLANAWSQVQIPLSSLNPTKAMITGITWQESTGNAQPTFYVDDIALVDIEDANAPQLSLGYVYPRSAPADGSTPVVVRVKVTDPQGIGSVSAVSVDTGLAGVGVVSLRDDGRSNDGPAGDGVYGTTFTIPVGTAQSERSLLASAQDVDGHVAQVALGTLAVLAPLTAPIPAALPQHIGWGSNAWSETPAQDWQATSGVPWNYVYQYITYGWESWGGSFVSRFVNRAWVDHNVPMVTVYMVLGTPTDCGETSTCYASKLKSATSVSAYLASLKRAAQEAKGTKPVIFNIEPDFYGYMQQLSNTDGRPSGVRANDPSSYPVALNISGYANNLSGFGRYIVDMIHATAPNALVAIETSMWATNSDPQGVTDAQAVQMAQTTAGFINAVGGAQADALVVEWSDRDSGSGTGRPWWDDTDQDVPRPSRALLWENALVSAANKRLFLWQVPVGNMALPGNACNKWKDNRAAYAFAHARDLADAGVMGILFGGGEGCSTEVTTDGGFVQSQGVIAYAAPATPTGLQAGSALGVMAPLWWTESTDTDLWGYQLVYVEQSGGPQYQAFVGRRNAASLLLPKAGTWNIRIQAVDAMGNMSGLSSAVTVVSSVDAKQVYLPAIRR